MADYPVSNIVNVNTFNSCIPKHGARCVPIPFDFTSQTDWLFDYGRMSQRDFLAFCQTLYVDNADNAVAVTIVIDQTNQRIVIPPNAQGYVSTLMSNIKFSIHSESGGSIYVHLINVPIPTSIWRVV